MRLSPLRQNPGGNALRRAQCIAAFLTAAHLLAAAADALAQAPAAPTNVTATAGDTEVALAWTAPSGTITGYDYSDDNGSTWTAITGSGSSTTCHAVTGLTNDTAKTFQVRARNGSNNGTASASASATPSATSDRAVLITLYDGTDGPNWSPNKVANWKSCQPLNDWYGVTATVSGGVTALNLPANDMEGSIPAALGNLSALQTLNLRANRLAGPIPSQLGNLTQLRTLDLNSTRANGTIPSELGDLTQLRTLNLSGNSLTGAIPSLDKLTRLTELRLGSNDLSGAIPSLDKLTSLTALTLGHNDLTGSIPSLDKLTSLETLDFAVNDLSGSIPSLDKLTSLKTLALNNNDLTGAIPSLDKLTSLTSLLADNNDLSGSIPSLDSLTRVFILELNSNDLSGPIPSLDKMAALRTLRLSRNRLTGSIPSLAALSRIAWVDLARNQLSGPVPPLGSLSTLRRLWIHHNNLTGPLPDDVAQLTGLRQLDISQNKLTGPLPSGMTGMTGLSLFWWVSNAGLCSPPTAAFRTWTAAIADHSAGPECALRLTLTAAPNPVAEGSSAVVTAAIAGETSAVTTVTVTAAAGPETDSRDFTLTGATISIPVGVDPVGGSVATIQTHYDSDTDDETVVVSATVSNTVDNIEVTPVVLVIQDSTVPDSNAAPEFTESIFHFTLPEKQPGRPQPVELGRVTATDADGDALTYGLLTGDRERFEVRPEDGAVLYVGPGEDYAVEPNRFVLRVFARDPQQAEAQAGVEVRVVPVDDGGGDKGNEPPRATDDHVTIREDESTKIDVLANDSDPDGDALSVAMVSKPTRGTAAVNGALVTYAPPANWHGADRFMYYAADGSGATVRAAVRVTVIPVNDAPTAVGTIPDQALKEGGEPATVDLTPYFEDVDGDALTYRAVVSDPGVAAAAVSGTRLTLTPTGYGSSAVTVTASDGDGLTATQRFGVAVSDSRVREVVEDTLAGLARSQLASTRMMLGRRAETAAARSRSRLSVMGREAPLDRASAGRAAQQLASGWLSQAQSWSERSRQQAALGGGLGAHGGAGGPGFGGENRFDGAAGLGGFGGAAGLGGFGGAAGLGGFGGAAGLGGFGGGSGGADTWLRGSEFLLAWGGPQGADGTDGTDGADGAAEAGRRWQVWGQGDVQTFQGASSAAAGYDGSLQTAWVGVDTSLTDRWLAGVAVAHSRGAGDWRAGGARGALSTTLTAVHPWVQWSDGATSVLASAGGGWGSAENVRQSGRRGESRLALRQSLAEVRRRLVAAGGVELGVRADAAWARLATAAGEETIDAQRAAVHQTRAGVEVAAPVRLGGLGLEPFGEVHARRDGGAGQTGTGMELVGGLRAVRSRLRVDAQGRMLVLHSAAGYRERGVGLTVSVGNPAQEGLSLSVSPRWGDQAAGGGALWQDEVFRSGGHPGGAAGAGWELDARADYGMRLGRSRRLVTWSGSWLQSAYGGYGFLLGGRID